MKFSKNRLKLLKKDYEQKGDYATKPFKIIARKGRFELTYI